MSKLRLMSHGIRNSLGMSQSELLNNMVNENEKNK